MTNPVEIGVVTHCPAALHICPEAHFVLSCAYAVPAKLQTKHCVPVCIFPAVQIILLPPPPELSPPPELPPPPPPPELPPPPEPPPLL